MNKNPILLMINSIHGLQNRDKYQIDIYNL